ncbi:NADH dehydrogenase [ubiquinone] 1 beta subcomplex subunit 11, mitochondrial [Ctenocephalides felis]|uniref:NADH dehydrogenase [ubiquinone] 1 beta subcomplex subunit 11, mitochondrial n=1 Tax=Ctenocephalides felis TaxID=7515 RepID=UPI000E6E1A31|nr:NADH dehydrogenase [ubiquinone] 1 beta subcomplex subunit 11, mitochondrial [Ctenocephalides felis]
MAALIRFHRCALRSFLSSHNTARFISTSKKNRDTVTTNYETTATDKPNEVIKKNWVSYGFDWKDEKEDLNVMHNTFFFAITLCTIVGGFVWTYLPDPQMRDWAQREAFLELRRREELGLPLIDKNLIDPSLIQLPTDEELGDTEIII